MLSLSFHHYMYPFHMTSRLSSQTRTISKGGMLTFLVVLMSPWIQVRPRTSLGSALALASLEITKLCSLLQFLAFDNSFLVMTSNAVSITWVPTCFWTLSLNLLSGTNNKRTSQLHALISGICRLTLTYPSYSIPIPPLLSISSSPSKLHFFNPYTLANDSLIVDIWTPECTNPLEMTLSTIMFVLLVSLLTRGCRLWYWGPFSTLISFLITFEFVEIGLLAGFGLPVHLSDFGFWGETWFDFPLLEFQVVGHCLLKCPQPWHQKHKTWLQAIQFSSDAFWVVLLLLFWWAPFLLFFPSPWFPRLFTLFCCPSVFWLLKELFFVSKSAIKQAIAQLRQPAPYYLLMSLPQLPYFLPP